MILSIFLLPGMLSLSIFGSAEITRHTCPIAARKIENDCPLGVNLFL
ncbi:hypothetical protein SLEP1_g21897 [Rubroshorea leprosula]|uniref:Uncharacterized protein n=1 Tax=Rubroshorea leprosula TaxID=152421 RepID=A0AAV5JGT5_9ROSI|nr:hypothetical protein SLEP1_g21897 [Rubroshorea leprosula]